MVVDMFLWFWVVYVLFKPRAMPTTTGWLTYQPKLMAKINVIATAQTRIILTYIPLVNFFFDHTTMPNTRVRKLRLPWKTPTSYTWTYPLTENLGKASFHCCIESLYSLHLFLTEWKKPTLQTIRKPRQTSLLWQQRTRTLLRNCFFSFNPSPYWTVWTAGRQHPWLAIGRLRCCSTAWLPWRIHLWESKAQPWKLSSVSECKGELWTVTQPQNRRYRLTETRLHKWLARTRKCLLPTRTVIKCLRQSSVCHLSSRNKFYR